MGRINKTYMMKRAIKYSMNNRALRDIKSALNTRELSVKVATVRAWSRNKGRKIAKT